MANPSTPLIKQFVALVKLESFDNSLSFAEKLAEAIVSNLDLKVVKKISYTFSPVGITLGYILSQSHLVIHTYPEEATIHIDLAICGNRSKKKFESLLKHVLSGNRIRSIKVKTLDFSG